MAHHGEWALVVPGHGEFRRGGDYVVSSRCLRLLELAAELAADRTPRVVVFSGWSPNGGPSEASQMLAAWPGRGDVELLAEETARTTAENMARTLELLRPLNVGEATIVCARTHLPRVRYFFGGVYPRAGIACDFRSPRSSLPSARAVLWETAALTVMPFQRRAALAELELDR